MNDRRLRIYLDDHLALMVAEVELTRRCRKSNRRTPLGEFLQQLENEVQAQKSIVHDVIHRTRWQEHHRESSQARCRMVCREVGTIQAQRLVIDLFQPQPGRGT